MRRMAKCTTRECRCEQRYGVKAVKYLSSRRGCEVWGDAFAER